MMLVLREVILEHEISTVSLGGSHENTGIVTKERLQSLSDELSKELSVEFIVVQNGEMLFHTHHSL